MTDNSVLVLNYMKKIAQAYPNLDEQLLIMSDMTKKLVLADRCTVWLYDEGKNELWSKVADGVDRLRISSDTGIAGHVFSTGESYIANDVQNDSFYNRNVSAQTGYVTRSMITTPLKYADGYCFGVFQVLNKLSDEGFNDTDIDICRTIAHYCEQALINSILANQLNSAQNDLIFFLSEVVESRSKETSNHVNRVSEICRVLGRYYGFDDEQVRTIGIASALHDVGKIGIPDSILNKPGKLTDEERYKMQEHTTIGYNILKDIETKVMNIASDICHQHHEKYNGTGYPRGLSGEKISIYARIAAVADVFDALAARRCYKPAWERERVTELFVKEKGGQFDPELAQLFLDNIDEFYDILDRYPDE